MKRKILSVFVLAALVLTLFAGCESASTAPTTVTNLSPEKAQALVIEALGLTEDQILSPFIHTGEYGDLAEPAYSVQFATLEQDYEFIVSAVDGEILYRSDKAE